MREIPGRGLANWAREQLERIGRSNWLGRNKEISRLLDLLATSTDAGLKFALPIHIAVSGSRSSGKSSNSAKG